MIYVFFLHKKLSLLTTIPIMPKPNTRQFRSLFKDDAVWGEQEVIKFRWFLIAVIIVFIIYIYISGDRSRALTSLLLASVYIFYNSVLNLLLKKYGSAPWIRFVSTGFDITILSLHIFNYSYFFQAIAVATAASTFLYPILMLLSVLRYDGRLLVFSTVYSIFCFNLIYIIRLPHIDTQLIEQVASANWSGQIYKSTYLLLMGYFLFSIPKMIKRLVEKQLVSIQQQNKVEMDLALEKQKKDLALSQLKKEQILNQRLEEHQATIEQQKMNLEEAIAVKDKLFSIIGHDLKSPFAAQTSIIDLLVADYKSYNSDDVISIMKTIKHSAHQGLELLDNLLDWSKQQNNLINPKAENVSINDSVNNTVALLQQTIIHKRLRILQFVDPELNIHTDMNILNTILRNILSNAIKFSYPDGKISIDSRQENSHIYIDICDTGVGMSAEHLTKLFVPDKKCSTPGTQNEPGTGLGLFLCKDLAKRINAEIMVKSKPGLGSTFSVVFTNN